LLPALWSPALSSGYGITIGSILVTVVAVRCKAGFWAAMAPWVIGYAAMLLYISIPTLILLYIGSAKLIDGTTVISAGDLFAVVGCLVIGSALPLVCTSASHCDAGRRDGGSVRLVADDEALR
jgi:hypothetical protein